MYGGQVGKDRDECEWEDVYETDESEPKKAKDLLLHYLHVHQINIVPYLQPINGSKKTKLEHTMSLRFGAKVISAPLCLLPYRRWATT